MTSRSGSRALATEATPVSTISNVSSGDFTRQEVELDGGRKMPFYVYNKRIDKPLLDKREYRLIRLENELEALLICDTETDKASAAMDVRVGHLSDPPSLQGMAHFCEHLLFMGTKKYPRENEYSEFLNNHSGSSNAFTALEDTNYFFDVGHAHLEGALDRFAQFFQEPLFDPSCSEREIRAVDSEHKKNLQSDTWRSFQLEKSLSDPSHAYSKFGTGNLETLWEEPRSRGIDIRDELLKFHAEHYSANMMKLVVLGRESVDQLTRWVVDKFAGVQNKGYAVPRFPGSPLGEEQLKTQVSFRTIKDVRLLDVTFPFPEQAHLYRSKPGQLLAYFIGHEGHGSLFSGLKQRGWANLLSAGTSLGAEGFELFKISIDLTQEGYEHYDSVVAAVFQYLDLLRKRPIEDWMYREVQNLSELRFAFKEKGNPALYSSTLAGQLQQPFPRDSILSGPYLLWEFDPALIAQTLDSLRPDRCRVMLAGREPPRNVKLDKVERWYGTEYAVTPLPTHVLEGQREELEGLALPKQNEFVPSDLSVRTRAEEVTQPTGRPQLLLNSDKARLWHKQDDRFFQPKANVSMLLRTPRVNASPRTAVLSRLFVELVKDALTEYSYDAEVAGLAYNLESQLDGLEVVVGGYNDKLSHLLLAVLDTARKLQVDPKRFAVVKDQAKRNYENFFMEAPYQHAVYYSAYLLTETMWTQDEKLAVIDGVTPDEVQAYGKDLFSAFFVEMLVHGNMDAAQASSLLAETEQHLGHAALPAQERLPPHSLLLPPGSNYSWTLEVPNASNVNSSLEYYLMVGHPTDVHRRATLGLLAQIAQEPCFDQLRTKEQLGYLVFSGVRKSIGQMGFRVIVQSERKPQYLEGRIDAFLDQLLQLLEQMGPEEFEMHRRSLIHKKLESVKNLSEETSRFWLSVHSGYYDFAHRVRDAAMLERVTKDDVVSMMRTAIHPSSTARSKLVVHLKSQATAEPFSDAALDAYLAFLAEQGVEIPAEARAAVREQAHSTQAMKEFVQLSFAEEQMPATLDQAAALAKVDELAQKHPAQGGADAVSAPPQDALPVQQITDPQAFKASLRTSDEAAPVLPWSEYEQDPHADTPVAPELTGEAPRPRANI